MTEELFDSFSETKSFFRAGEFKKEPQQYLPFSVTNFAA
jgi:hypothetical protein